MSMSEITAMSWRRARQRAMLKWTKDTFGIEALNAPERAARVLEEAMEVAHACGTPPDIAAAIMARVYNAPTGDARKEIGQVAIVAEVLAEYLGVNLEEATELEWSRINMLGPDHFRKRHAKKFEQGICMTAPAGGGRQR